MSLMSLSIHSVREPRLTSAWWYWDTTEEASALA